ncbi:MAG: hypothetical protein JRJ87_18065 [Deltaproteobacteria bacterium]|nr:hypothetical protein [Deltaproteobacteria bacterium]
MNEAIKDRLGGEAYSVQWLEDIAFFQFGDRPLFFSKDLEICNNLTDSFGQCAESKEIKVVVLKGFPEKVGSQEYDEFYRVAKEGRNHLDIHRMLNVFNQLILTIARLDKFVIFVESGRVISQFFNVSLVCDYRILGDNSVIEKEYLKHGLISKGGLALHLSRLMGRARALQLMLDEDDISAELALELVLLDEVVPVGELDKATWGAARLYAGKPVVTVSGTKRLLGYDLSTLSDYLDYENSEIVKILDKALSSRGAENGTGCQA